MFNEVPGKGNEKLHLKKKNLKEGNNLETQTQ
jgi:hypothetical protein